MDLDITFGDNKVDTVYIKMEAHDWLLLFEGVRWHLGTLTYHQNVQT